MSFVHRFALRHRHMPFVAKPCRLYFVYSSFKATWHAWRTAAQHLCFLQACLFSKPLCSKQALADCDCDRACLMQALQRRKTKSKNCVFLFFLATTSVLPCAADFSHGKKCTAHTYTNTSISIYMVYGYTVYICFVDSYLLYGHIHVTYVIYICSLAWGMFSPNPQTFLFQSWGAPISRTAS